MGERDSIVARIFATIVLLNSRQTLIKSSANRFQPGLDLGPERFSIGLELDF